jgi:hypothetical protein
MSTAEGFKKRPDSARARCDAAHHARAERFVLGRVLVGRLNQNEMIQGSSALIRQRGEEAMRKCAGEDRVSKKNADQKTKVRKPIRKLAKKAKFSSASPDVIIVKKYVVRLDADERERCNEIIGKGKSSAKRQLKARILLKADVSKNGEAWSDSRIIEALATTPSMVYRVRKQLVEEGFEAVLSRKQRQTSAIARIFDGEKEARLIQLACSQAPEGRARWTLSLLADKVVELKIVPAASRSTVGLTLKKTFSSPISRSNGLFPRIKTPLL